MSESQYAKDLKHLLASLNDEQRDEQGDALADEEAMQEIHVYPVEGGGILLRKEPLEDEDHPPATIIDSEPPATPPPTAHPTGQQEAPYFLYFVLLLFLFLVMDAANSQLIALLTPTVTITITPDVRTMTLQSTAQLGKLLAPITVTESQTVPTSGHGHQDARQATGSVTFSNGQQTVQTVAQGTVFTGSDGVTIVTTQPATIPPGNPSTGYGTVTVLAQAQQAGSKGNLPAGDVNTTIALAVFVKNNPFSHGQDERDYRVVTRTDRDSVAVTLQAKVSASMTAALQGQLLPGQALHATPCSPALTADHGIGDEATYLTVTVSKICSAIAYDSQQLTARATHLLTTQATHALGTNYLLSGNVQVSVTHTTTHTTTPGVILAFICQGTYVYTLNGQAQQRIKTLIAGQPRLTALHVLLRQRGIQTASISGIAENQFLPDDLTHLHLLIMYISF